MPSACAAPRRAGKPSGRYSRVRYTTCASAAAPCGALCMAKHAALRHVPDNPLLHFIATIRGSYLYYTGSRAFQTVMAAKHNFLHRQVCLLRAASQPLTPDDAARLRVRGLSLVVGESMMPGIWSERMALCRKHPRAGIVI